MGLFNGKNEELEDLKKAMLRKFPSLGTTASGLKMKMSKSVPTAETDGETVYFNPDFLHSLTYDERVFTMSHETMHVAFKHIDRLKNPDGTMKDMRTWNEATDAVINQILESEGLPIKEGMINMPEAIDKSAEDMYKKIYAAKQAKREQQRQQQEQQKGQQQNGQGQGQQQQQQQQSQGGQGQQQQQQQGEGQGDQQQQSGQSGDQQQKSQGSQGQQGDQQQQGQGQQGQPDQQQGDQGDQQQQSGGGDSQDSDQQNGQNSQGGGNGNGSQNQQRGDQQQNGQGGGQGDEQDQDNFADQQQGNQGNDSGDDLDDLEENSPSNHSMWEKAFEKHEKEKERKKQEQEKKKQEEEKKKKQEEEKKKKQQEKKKDDKPEEENQDEQQDDDEGDGEGKSKKDKYSDEKDNFQKQGMERNEPDAGDSQNENGEQDSNAEMEKLEKEFSELNKKLKKKLADEARKKIKDRTYEGDSKGGKGGDVEGSFGELGEEKPVVSWKTLLKAAFEKTEYRWSYRRSNRDNGYSARIERVESYDQPATEVILDTSYSINDELLRGFLRQVKALLKQAYGKEGGPKETKLSIGCFDDCFHGFTEIKTPQDIDNYYFVGRGGTNIDSAVRAFSKDPKVNKIVFTDGFDSSFPRGDHSKVNCIYVIFDNPNFKAPNGKTIYVSSAEIIKDAQQLLTGKIADEDDIELE